MRGEILHENVISKQTFTLFLIFSLLIVAADSTTNNSQIQCSKRCIALNCDNVGIKYGKYCGVGYSGCPGENPCDDVDACCQIHDDCVDKHGMTNIKCHQKFKRCIKKAQKSGKAGFSKDCPYDVVVHTMVQGMDMAILMSQFASPKLDL
ncbi:probable phospholipase A2 homolog 1 [Chenopodium quinoa]|uniref:phospholipase A2 n=1 Tax=Chenopodium quinoa TaxID=63459 RepID=A0A803MDC0_CHEQI|nr:probable phospholipase A2 homolog 1 [Chenopodium quinoa]